MLAVERQAQIRTVVDDRTFASVRDLCTLLNVSDITVRRDLDLLERAGQLRRTHGGAMSLRSAPDAPYTDRAGIEVATKHAIGTTAAALVQEGETIFLNAGSTVTAMARALVGRRNLTVVTNGYTIIPILTNEPGIQLILTGGMSRSQTGSLVGPLAERTVSELRVDRAFFGATGVDLEAGWTNSSLDEASLQRVLLRAAGAIYLLADHTKFGRVSFARVGPLSALTAIVTDAQIDRAIHETFTAADVSVLLSPA